VKNKPVLYIFSGLPAVGKTTIAKKLAHKLNAAYLRIDTIEQALRDLCNINVEGEGYRLAYRVALDNLCEGNSVIADCCNPITLTRDEWHNVAISTDAEFVDIEVICSNKSEHKIRAEGRTSDIDNLKLPSWNDIENRDYESWGDSKRIVIDTFNKKEEESFLELINSL